MQAFKENDPKELKVRSSFDPALSLISSNRSEFYEGAYTSYGLGQILFNLKNDPMARLVDLETFLESYPAFHELFTRPGTFEFYLQLFRSIWGDQVEVEFIIPAPGHLKINISALTSRLDSFGAREVSGNAYQYHEVSDHEGDILMFQTSQGIKTQEEVNRMIVELHPQGIFLEINLIIN